MDRSIPCEDSLPYGAIEIENLEKTESFKVNGQRLKPFLEYPAEYQAEEIMLLHDPHYSA